jgi:hypothetical protein
MDERHILFLVQGEDPAQFRMFEDQAAVGHVLVPLLGISAGRLLRPPDSRLCFTQGFQLLDVHQAVTVIY